MSGELSRGEEGKKDGTGEVNKIKIYYIHMKRECEFLLVSQTMAKYNRIS
jgi:hypothetical protein